ncbi:MAG: methyltransferase domain-containing protein [Candidatus Nanopelagicales bacterium]|nr:methyltransferase domain-containing protein [Candidatus Nanopelagicales bacterium]MDZ4250114.1 methyltransferase domain-containing protein [Candidatus Nanopelagicales bacterium]
MGIDRDQLDSVRSVYRYWGVHPGLYAAQDWVTFLGRPDRVRAAAVAAMGARPGDRVLEIGCGTGRNFRYVQDVIGHSGTLVGVDASPDMLAAARELSARRGWRNVSVIEGDASELRVAGFDRVLAVLALSAFPEPSLALARCHEALRPGGTLAVCDARGFAGRLSALNRLVVPVYRRWAAWNPDRGIPAGIADVFGNVSTQSLNGGTFFIATAVKTEGS